jgi:hypothetical protein
MNNHRHHLLWLMLPAVLVVGYFVIFQPGGNEVPVATQNNVVNTDPASIEQPDPDATTGVEDATLPLTPDIAREQEEVDRDREFINYAFPLLSTWNLQDVKPLLAEETIAASSDAELSEVMSVLEDRLGDLRSFDTPQPVALEGAVPEQDEALDGELQHYQFVAYYEAGEAEIDLILHKSQNDSSLYSFNIHVPTQQEEVF